MSSLERLSVIERQHLVHQACTVHDQKSVHDAQLKDQDVWDLCEQVSQQIDAYNTDHPGEMLPKTPNDIYQGYINGESTFLVAKYQDRPVFLYHGAIYPLLSSSQSRTLDWQVFEFGTEIAHSQFRNMGLGQKGAEARRKWVVSQNSGNVVGLLTVKQQRTAHVWGALNAKAISWQDHPYLATLTDVCTGVNPVETGRGCPHRRTTQQSSSRQLTQLMSTRGSKIPCTLIVLDPQKAAEYEAVARFDHARRICRTEILKIDDTINPELYLEIAQYYQLINSNNDS